MKNKVQVRLIRHATLVVEMNGVQFLVDPFFADKDAYDPIPNAGNNIRYPKVALPVSENELLAIVNKVDAVLVTHTHRDHWDVVAQEMIPKDKPLMCQPEDLETIKGQGFTNVTAINGNLNFKDITISRTGGQHGTGEIGKLMGIVSGFVLNNGETVVYIAGDTIWCEEVKQALDQYRPDITIVNGSAPQYITGDPITMTPDDTIAVMQHLPSTKVMSVHMDTVGHAKVSREDLKKALAEKGFAGKVLIPEDGETMRF